MTLHIERTSATGLRGTRHFAATPEKVWLAHVTPDLIRQWMLGPDGWEMSVCEFEAQTGGKIHYEWREIATGHSFGLTGEIELFNAPHHLIHIERMHLPDPTPDNRVETKFAPDTKGGTVMTLTMQVDDAATMEAMIATGMTDGMEASYVRLDRITADG